MTAASKALILNVDDSARDRASFDVLVNDIGMPETDGYDLIAAVRARAAECGGRIPALAVTAYATREDESRILAAGYQAYLAKPVEPAVFADAVGRLCGPDVREPGMCPGCRLANTLLRSGTLITSPWSVPPASGRAAHART